MAEFGGVLGPYRREIEVLYGWKSGGMYKRELAYDPFINGDRSLMDKPADGRRTWRVRDISKRTENWWRNSPGKVE